MVLLRQNVFQFEIPIAVELRRHSDFSKRD
jgi:hypothetical protein